MELSRKTLAIVLAMGLVLGLGATALAAGDLPFSDIAGHWAQDEIVSQADRGITEGHEDRTSGPDENVTRAQMMVFFDREQDPSDAPIVARRGCEDSVQGPSTLAEEAFENGGILHEALP